jgi:ribose transport system substrate-binding protein
MYDRKRSSDIVEQHLEKVRAEGGTVHAIFCTNDEMALGAVDAIQKLSAAGEHHGDLVVVGVDATREAVATIDSGGTAFRATVVQASRQVAEVAVNTMLKLSRGDRVEAVTMIPTTIYPIGNASSAIPDSPASQKRIPGGLPTGAQKTKDQPGAGR